MLLSPRSFSSRAEGSTNFGTRAEPCWHRRPVVSLTAVLLKRSTRVSFEFIPIKPLAATGSGGPGSYAADFHHDIPNALLPQADPVFDDAATLDAAVDMLNPQPAGVERLVGSLLRPWQLVVSWSA